MAEHYDEADKLRIESGLVALRTAMGIPDRSVEVARIKAEVASRRAAITADIIAALAEGKPLTTAELAERAKPPNAAMSTFSNLASTLAKAGTIRKLGQRQIPFDGVRGGYLTNVYGTRIE